VDPGDAGELTSEDKPRAKEALQTGVQALAELQDVLYAQDRWSVLLIFQAMDTAGKDGAIKHVMSEINPQGCQVLPSRRGAPRISITTISGAASERCRNAAGLVYSTAVTTRRPWWCVCTPSFSPDKNTRRSASPKTSGTNAFRTFVALSVTSRATARSCASSSSTSRKQEQQKRFLERLDNPDKNWKFSASHAKERGFWDKYMETYEATTRETATEDSPWHVVPANHMALPKRSRTEIAIIL
jgi:Polyphosphate kinase 2 (PPK2)